MLLYGVVETLNGNWATVYLSAERHVSARDASFALTAFWIMVTLGRVIFALLDRCFRRNGSMSRLPILLAAIFQGVAHADGGAVGIVSFAAAGLAARPCCRSASASAARSFRARPRPCPAS